MHIVSPDCAVHDWAKKDMIRVKLLPYCAEMDLRTGTLLAQQMTDTEQVTTLLLRPAANLKLDWRLSHTRLHSQTDRDVLHSMII